VRGEECMDGPVFFIIFDNVIRLTFYICVRADF
jgi:hypothetical protein